MTLQFIEKIDDFVDFSLRFLMFMIPILPTTLVRPKHFG